MHSIALITLALAFGTSCSTAQVSLYIPGFDEQPLSVNVLGVGSDGQTTYEILPGTATGTFDEVPFFGTATLVEGATAASLTMNIPEATLSLGFNCGIANGLAVCTAVAGSTTTDVETETVSSFIVQGGATVSGSASSTGATATATATASGGSTATTAGASGFSTTKGTASSGSASPTSSGAAATSSSTSGGPKSFACSLGATFAMVAGLIGLLAA
ncbi:hypothetical protein PLICRDRAFT_696217 [Plicaturopsis crispa FD-325 SS-3]|nr:hypothetical protein PLICRDRAFT_696217 [Plicaturopsis crispa FD-325 SS-3]